MKNLLITLLFFNASIGVKAQINQGTFLIDSYYGFPNIYDYFNRTNVSKFSTVKHSSFGPIGVKGEYLFSEKFGFGVDLFYTEASRIGVEYADMQTGKISIIDVKKAKLNIMGSFNFHLSNLENHDLYFQFGIGYSKKIIDERYYQTTNFDVLPIFPVAMRVALGYRYFFKNNLSLNSSIGLGGPLISFGIGYRFHSQKSDDLSIAE
jgi:hypothetical protein